VLEVRGRQIRIGIQAPEHVPVEREEVLLAQVRSALTGKPAAHRPRVPQGWLALREGH
jgi:sRNA-binding carbon storage regulator CsrA